VATKRHQDLLTIFERDTLDNARNNNNSRRQPPRETAC